MIDFTLRIYKKLLEKFSQNGFSFQTLENFAQHIGGEKTVVIRHDVDRLPENALAVAIIENEFDIKASY